ncbi:hypothetical protein HDV00_004129, partial [Rhizophlyctis rosea]
VKELSHQFRLLEKRQEKSVCTIEKLLAQVETIEEDNASLKEDNVTLRLQLIQLEKEVGALRKNGPVDVESHGDTETSSRNRLVADDAATIRNVLRQQGLLIASLQAEILEIRGVYKDESYFQDLLAKRVGVADLKSKGNLTIPGVGTTDVTTPEAHYEIKRWSKYDIVPGQLGKYQLKVRRSKSIACFFGRMPTAERLEIILRLMFGVAVVEICGCAPERSFRNLHSCCACGSVSPSHSIDF